ATKNNIKTFKKQLELLGFTYDWYREVNTTDPKYYKWTQWAFLQMFKRGLAYESYEPINWCPKCQTGLANEDLEDGKCERCGSEIERKPMRQWVLKITDYADRLLNDLDKLDKWPAPIKEMQRNWIGRSEGALIRFPVIARSEATKQSYGNEDIASSSPTARSRNDNLEVFTTRPDTLFGATYMVIAPENSLIENCKLEIENLEEVNEYVERSKKKSDLERTDLAKEKTGVELKGVKVVNPANGEELPIFVADYVLTGYGTGAIMAVPAHDERDFEFSKKYGIPIREVVAPLIVNEKGEDAFKKDAPIIERDAVVCVVKHWSEDKYLGIRWLKNDWQGFVIGGIEAGEDTSVAGIREITEETGYKNVEYIKPLGSIVHSKFFQALKKQNRFAHFVPLLFKLKDGEMDNIAEEEKNLHEVMWLSPEEVGKFANREDMRIIWKRVFENECYAENGVSINSDFLNELSTVEAKEKMIQWLEEKKIGQRKVQYKLRDWVFSRQRYWGEPIPLVHCEKCGVVPVPEKDLPLELPKVKHYEPTGTGESPLANIEKWVNTKCPVCGGPAKRETNTMPQWAGSCWYYLRYIDPNNDKALVDKEREKYWSPVDFYVGGAEHATRHLIYARFWHKFLFDIGAVNYDEPFTRLQNVGLILAEDGRKMSKRWGNVINPDAVVEDFGADAMRVYEVFMGPFDQPCAWSTQGLVGAKRFLEKVWALKEKALQNAILTPTQSGERSPRAQILGDSSITPQNDNEKITTLLHQTIKKVTDDIENMRFNTAISQLMILVNEMTKEDQLLLTPYSLLLKLLSPFAPHIAEEIWAELGNKESIFLSDWPAYDAELAKDAEIILAVQVNGKLRDILTVSADISEEEAKQTALASEKIQKWLEGNQPKKIIYVKGKLISIVV
ncbi:MAG: class I tRNA ligase family protein, partial [bacterium]